MFKNLNTKKLRQNYFGLKTGYLLANIQFQDIVSVISSDIEHLGCVPEEGYQPFCDGNIHTYKDGDIYAIYYNKVRIVINDGKEKLIKVSILGQNDTWKVWELDSKGKNIRTIDSPETDAYTVYTYCDVLIPTGRMMVDERYTRGTWNEYVYNSVTEIIEYINTFKERNKFNNYYNS